MMLTLFACSSHRDDATTGNEADSTSSSTVSCKDDVDCEWALQGVNGRRWAPANGGCYVPGRFNPACAPICDDGSCRIATSGKNPCVSAGGQCVASTSACRAKGELYTYDEGYPAGGCWPTHVCCIETFVPPPL